MGGESRAATPAQTNGYPRYASHPKGKKIQSIYKDRLRQFTDGGQYGQQSLNAKIDIGRASGSDAVKLEVWSAPDQTRPLFKDAIKNEFKSAQKGDSFGPSWTTHWFKVTLTVPKALAKEEHVELHWDGGNEGLIYDVDGTPLQGLTGGGERVEWIIPTAWRDGKAHDIYIEMACNAMFGNAPGGDSIQPPILDRYFTLREADIVAINLEARQLFIDFWIIGDAAREFPDDSWEQHEALEVCNAIMDAFIDGDGNQDAIVKSRKIASKYVGDVNSAKVYDNDEYAIVNAIGNCHIDTCWLWPWAETKRKVVRSWMNQVDLLDRYPEHRFVASQAQQWWWLEKIYPAAFKKVQAKVEEGTFQPIGGSWVEHDTNMPSGESLVRQFLYGQRYFESRFGKRCQTFWLPDTFGYSTQLPQLCRLSGMTRFFTQKLSWNNINNFPHTTFNWVALDGSQVICHMAPCETYTADAHFGDVNRSVTHHKSLDQDATSLLPFGKGDGGGGPTWQMLEKLRRARGLSDKTGRLPRVKIANTVDEFFAALEKKQKTTAFATWYGELYFELHRGTYTTQANNKKFNRKSEILLHDIEFFATLASIHDSKVGNRKAYHYPKGDLDELWMDVLLCQFHDCLPGSCIEMCYDDSDELYAKVMKKGEKLLEDALQQLGFGQSIGNSNDFVLNTRVPQESGYELPSEVDGIRACLPRQHRLMQVSAAESQTQPVAIAETGPNLYTLSNNAFEVEINNGVITSIFDKRVKREVLPPNGKANQLVIFDDKPLYWQAWDVEVYHLESRKEIHPSSKSWISERSSTRVSLTTKFEISEKSSIELTTILHATPSSSGNGSSDSISSWIETVAEVDWHETMKFLKVEFPTTLRSQTASYETQYGIVQRPTHYNTSWDMAKFEVCCHKFADLSESNYGVSILNESKYGFATAGSLMRLSLLRSPKAPDAHADMGKHTIKWAILPHVGPLGPATVDAAISFNYPSRVRSHSHAADVQVLMNDTFRLVHDTPADRGLVLDWVKRAEDDEDVATRSALADDSGKTGLKTRKGKSVVLRLYDALGGKTRGKILFGNLKVSKVFRCNALEDDEEEIKVDAVRSAMDVPYNSSESSVRVELRAFEVLTLRVVLE